VDDRRLHSSNLPIVADNRACVRQQNWGSHTKAEHLRSGR
jgi:hypothetical protein